MTVARPLQGQEDTPIPRWINMRQVGRIFNTTAPTIGKQLDLLGLRENGRPSPRATRLGIGRLLPSSAHLATPVIQWHASKVVGELTKSGMQPANPFEVFCRAAADKVATSLRSFRENEVPGPTDSWWITHQMQEHLTRVPDNRREDFVDALIDQLHQRRPKINMGHVYAMIEALGERQGYQSRKAARELQVSSPDTSPARARTRL